MVAVLDTNIVVDFLRNKADTALSVERYAEICLPTIVCGELIFGATISGNPTKNLEKVVDFIGRSSVLEVDLAVAQQYAEIRKHLQAKGKPIPENDLWIAATAHAYGLKLISRDQHFAGIDFLNLELWK
jgi:tRNA(fMet)-specific endonuclease VapC